jgi:hypothetical protein
MLAYVFFAKEKDALTSWTCLPQTLELIKSVTPISFPAGMDSVNIISEKLRVFFFLKERDIVSFGARILVIKCHACINCIHVFYHVLIVISLSKTKCIFH